MREYEHPHFGHINEYQSEKASNSYLMSMVAIMAGLGLPFFNLLATLIFYLANRKESLFVRWHCTQALISQFILLVFNAILFAWLLTIVFGNNAFNRNFFAYLGVVLFINLVEFIATIYTAIQTRKGLHVEWWILGPLSHIFMGTQQKESSW